MRSLAKALALLMLGCGSPASAQWTPLDTTSATDLANAALSLEAVCSRDGGPCPAAPVRSMESGTYCAAAAMLFRHNQAVPDAGGEVKCQR